MSRADALIALMLICGIVVKLSGNKASIQIYLVIANQVFGW